MMTAAQGRRQPKVELMRGCNARSAASSAPSWPSSRALYAQARSARVPHEGEGLVLPTRPQGRARARIRDLPRPRDRRRALSPAETKLAKETCAAGLAKRASCKASMSGRAARSRPSGSSELDMRRIRADRPANRRHEFAPRVRAQELPDERAIQFARTFPTTLELWGCSSASSRTSEGQIE